MSKQQFDIDSVLDNIRSKLQQRDVSLQKEDQSNDDSFLELTDVVYDEEADFGNFLRFSDNDNNLFDTKNGDTISDIEGSFLSANAKKEIHQHIEKYIKDITSGQLNEDSRIENLVRREARLVLQMWMEKNLATIVREQVSNEINKITKTYMK